MRRWIVALAMLAMIPAEAQTVEPIDDLQWLFIEDTVALIQPPTPAVGERARALMAEAATARAKGDNGAMRRALAEARVLLGKGEWTPATAFTVSLAVRPQRSAVDPARPLAVEVGQHFAALPPGEGPVTIELGLRKSAGRAPPSAAVDWRAKAERPIGDLADVPAVVTMPMTGVVDGSYDVVARVSRGGQPFGLSARRIFVTAGLDRDLATIAARTGTAKLSPSGKATVLYPGDLARTLDDGTRQVRDVALRPLLDRALALLDRGEVARAKGDMERHYWLAAAGRYEPYRLFIPQRWDGKAALPLVVLLHGSAGDQNSMLANGKTQALAEARGWALLSPMGYAPNGGWGNHLPVVLANGTSPAPRPSTIAGLVLPKDGVTPEPAEEDVLAALADVRAAYPIDGRRIYLAGNSMGGEGVWHLAARHPKLWAAAAPGAGAIGPDVYSYKALGTLPVLGVHGDKDPIISYAATATMVERLKAAGGDATLLGVPGGGHGAFGDVLDRIFDWFASRRRAADGAQSRR